MPKWVFPISPVAASRPRVSRRGAYFTGPYKYFRQDMRKLVPEVIGKSFEPIETPVSVELDLFVKRPKETKLGCPKPDIDNYIKAIFDSMNEYLWYDDTLVQEVYARKRWAPKSEAGYFVLDLKKLRRKA